MFKGENTLWCSSVSYYITNNTVIKNAKFYFEVGGEIGLIENEKKKIILKRN